MAATLKELAMRPYQDAIDARLAGRKKLVAWVTSDTPHALLEAMGIICLYPENHAALCSAKKMGVELCEAAEEKGYARDLCSYFRINYGSCLTGKSPIGPLPRPDFLLCCNNICDVVMKWYQILGEHFHAPVFYLDAPSIPDGVSPEIKENILIYVKAQLRDFIEFLEDFTGKRLNFDRVSRALKIGGKTTALWREILEFGKLRPSPITAFDAFSHMGPIVTQRVTKEGLTYYRLLKTQLRDKIAANQGAVPREEFRLFWDNIAIWYALRNLSSKLSELNANVVVSSYTSCWARDEFINPDFSDPVGAIARQLCGDFLNQGQEAKIQYCLQLIRDFAVDGAIIHANKSCVSYTGGGLELKRRIQALGLPVLVIEADQGDSRYFDEAKINRQIESFIQMLREGPAKIFAPQKLKRAREDV